MMKRLLQDDAILKNAPERKDVYRPWGRMRQYVHNGECTVNILTVEPGMRLSFQSHEMRAELWVVLDDGARIQLENRIDEYEKGDEIWIPVQDRHRLSNAGEHPLRILEITFGDWQQDDIVRFDDDFGRCAGRKQK